MKTDNNKPITVIENGCPKCGSDVHDGTGTGWEICKNSDCNWMG